MIVFDHIGFNVSSFERPLTCYRAALAPLGVRTQYAPDYYAAFVLDPDGHNIEAVTPARE